MEAVNPPELPGYKQRSFGEVVQYGDKFWSLTDCAWRDVTSRDVGEVYKLGWRPVFRKTPDDSGHVPSMSPREIMSVVNDPANHTKVPAPDKLEAIKLERGKVYGESELSHENIGLAWTGILQQHYGIRFPESIPAWLVEHMMVQFKIQRSARVFHQDNFDDAKNYLEFAERDQKKTNPKPWVPTVHPQWAT
jgi:hypothetical protein